MSLNNESEKHCDYFFEVPRRLRLLIAVIPEGHFMCRNRRLIAFVVAIFDQILLLPIYLPLVRETVWFITHGESCYSYGLNGERLETDTRSFISWIDDAMQEVLELEWNWYLMHSTSFLRSRTLWHHQPKPAVFFKSMFLVQLVNTI